MLITHNPRLVRFACTPCPRHPTCGQHPRPGLAKWDAPSLSLLSTISLTSLHLSRLSQSGARALSALLSSIGEYSTLEDLSLDFVWLDDSLCERIVEAGRRVRKLKISTSGTKLSDKGLVAIAEGCDALEDLVLEEVQGDIPPRHRYSHG